MLKVKPSGKQTYAKNRRPCRTQMENATLAHFMKKSMHLMTGFLSDYQSKKISNYQELIQSDPISCPQNQKGNN